MESIFLNIVQFSGMYFHVMGIMHLGIRDFKAAYSVHFRVVYYSTYKYRAYTKVDSRSYNQGTSS